MTQVEQFSRELARLVWLLVYRPTLVDEQKAALRSALHVVRDEGCRVRQSELAHAVANAAATAQRGDEFPWLAELSNRMATHFVRSIEVHQAARASEVLELCRALATHGMLSDDGVAFDAQILALAPTTLTVHLGRDGFVRTPTPPGGMRAVGLRPALTPAVGMTSVADALVERMPRSAFETTSGLRRPTPAGNARIVQDAIMPPQSDLAPSDLIIRLRGELSPDEAPPLLDEIGRLLEDAARASRWVLLLDIAGKLLDREAEVTDANVRRAFGIQFRRLSKTGVLRGLIESLVTHRELRDDIQRVLVRLGDPAADLLVEMLVSSENASARRAYRDAILKCPTAAEPLTHLLRDHRWFVVRNAAELLGELNAKESDQELINTLRHADTRVRHAATLALIKLGTPRAVHTIIHALQDAESSLRMKAAIGLGAVQNGRVVPALLAALDTEADIEVQHAIIAALGRHPTEVVVVRLMKEASSGSILRRRAISRRQAAIAALGEAGTHEARSALRALAMDREAGIRESAERALAQGAAAPIAN